MPYMNVLAEMQVFITESSFWPYLFVKVEIKVING